MRFGLFLLAALGVLALWPCDAAASEAPATPEVTDDASEEPGSPVEQPEDWIAVAGIVCYSALPALAVIALVVLTYRWIEQGQSSIFLPAAERNAWMWRASAGATRPPPDGLVLLRF